MKITIKPWIVCALLLLGILGLPSLVRANGIADYRFKTVEGEKGTAKIPGFIYEEKNVHSRKIGATELNTVLYLLKDEGTWLYVESRTVRGFIPAKETSFRMKEIGEEKNQREQRQKSATEKGQLKMVVSLTELQTTDVYTGGRIQQKISLQDLSDQEEALLSEPSEEDIWMEASKEIYAEELVLPLDSKCFAYTNTTIYPTSAEIVYGICKYGGIIRSETNENAAVIGVLPRNSLVYLLVDAGEEYYYVESGMSRGFVRKSSLITGEEAEEMLSKEGADTFERAMTEVFPEENPVFYYTLLFAQEDYVETNIVEGGRG